jgi:hypothetical protein
MKKETAYLTDIQHSNAEYASIGTDELAVLLKPQTITLGFTTNNGHRIVLENVQDCELGLSNHEIYRRFMAGEGFEIVVTLT